MPRRTLCLCVLLSSLGCQLSGTLGLPVSHSAPRPAVQLWEQGQAAVRAGRVDEAIELYRRSLAEDPSLARNHLSLAAAYLEQGNEAAACPHLERYLAACPEHLAVRGHYAELLRKRRQLNEARTQYERFDADAQETGLARHGYLIHCHSRLMQIAEEQQDEYAEHLHRGIGLYHLACERPAATEEDRQNVESLLCKAAGELTLARMQRPDEARPCWYLYEVWTRLDQRQPAVRCLRAADEAAPFSYLTPHEQNSLQMAYRRHERLPASH